MKKTKQYTVLASGRAVDIDRGIFWPIWNIEHQSDFQE